MNLLAADLEPLDFGSPNEQREPLHRENLYRLGQRVMALMAWPHQKERRDRFLAAAYAKQLHDIGRAPLPVGFPTDRPDLWEQVRQNVADEILTRDFLPVGGYGAVADADSLEKQFATIRKYTNRWLSVSAQLWICRSIAVHHPNETSEGGSLSKARYILSQCTKWNRNLLEENWQEYRAVAHLCVALDLLAGRVVLAKDQSAWSETPQPGFFFLDGLPALLAIARNYQEWATSYIPFSRSEPVLNPSRLWLVGKDMPPWELPRILPKLDGPYLEALRQYRAPIRAK